MFPAWPASGPEPNASRPPAHSFSAPTGQKLPFTFSSRSGQPVNRQMLFFAASVFKTRKHEVHIFSASKAIVSGLAGQYLPLPILLQPPTRQLTPFRRQPANTSRRPSFHTGPHNPQPTNSLPPGLAGRRLTFLPTIFPKSTNRHLPRHPPGFRLSVPPTPISSHHFPNSLHFFRPAAASPTSRPNAKRSFARGCSLQGCRWCGRGARVSFFLLSLFLFFPIFFPISLAPRLRRDAFIFLFIFVFFFLFAFVLIFVFLFVFFAFIFAFLFLLFSFYFSSDFYSCFSLSFLFTFSFFLLLLLSLFSLFFSLCFTFLPSLLQSLSSLSNRSPTIHFFYSAANLSNSIQPLPGSSKNEKNIGKRIHGGEMASRERTGGGRKDRGTEWSPERDGKKCILRGMEQWAERNEWREEID